MLLHVLVTGAVVALIGASLLRMALLRYMMGARSGKLVVEKRADTGAYANLLTLWNAQSKTCYSDGGAVSGYTCTPNANGSPVPGICGCTCTPVAQTNPPTLPTVYAGQGLAPGGTPTNCPIYIKSPDM